MLDFLARVFSQRMIPEPLEKVLGPQFAPAACAGEALFKFGVAMMAIGSVLFLPHLRMDSLGKRIVEMGVASALFGFFTVLGSLGMKLLQWLSQQCGAQPPLGEKSADQIHTSRFAAVLAELKPVWNESLGFALIAGLIAGAVIGLLYGFDLLGDAIPVGVNGGAPPQVRRDWLVRFLRSMVFATPMGVLLGSIFAAQKAPKTHRLSAAAWCVLLGGVAAISMILIVLASRIIESSLGFLLGNDYQGDIPAQFIVVGVGVFTLAMIAHDRARAGATLGQLARANLKPLLATSASGSVIAAVFWKQTMAGDSTIAHGLLISIVLLIWSALLAWLFMERSEA